MAKEMFKPQTQTTTANPRLAHSTPTRKPVTAKPIQKQNDPIANAVITVSSVNVRKGPGMNYARIGGLVEGKEIQIYAVEDGWLKIAYGTEYGYVDAQFTSYKVQTQEPEPPKEPEPEPPKDPEPGVVDNTPPAGATYTGSETVRKGSSNKEAVKTLQLYLNKYLAPLGVSAMSVDSSFGNTTWKYLMYYQYSRNLCDSSGKIEVDGICGPKTWAAIKSGAPVVYDINEPIAFHKGYKLDANCTQPLSVGGGMTPEAASHFEDMNAAAKSAGHTIKPSSTFRAMTSMGTTKGVGAKKSGQIELFVEHGGNTTYAARPGYSNHQEGKAIDIAGIAKQNDTSALFKWLQKNAGKYDFENYKPECWHWNYIK